VADDVDEGTLDDVAGVIREVAGALRRRRNEIEYPQRPGEALDPDEAPGAIAQADAIVTAATRLVPQLTPFR
jgi:hypothetical protein